MKKIVSFLLVVCFAILAVACGRPAEPKAGRRSRGNSEIERPDV